MGTITALTAQKRNNDRINVFLDGAFAFGLAAVVAAHLRVGQSLTPATITSLQEEDSVEKAKEKALNFITYRPRSVAEVERKLRDKGFDESVTTRVVERLQAVDLLDDMAFARYWVEQRETFKPRSRLALQQELREKGVARSVIEAVLSDVDETAAARRAAQKQLYRWSNLAEAEFRKKLGGFLQRRGFHYEIVREITEELWAGTLD
jgi:regulatory protein